MISVRHHFRRCLLIVCLAMPGLGNADIVIESQEAERGNSRVSISEDWARIDNADWEIYILIDLRAGRVYAVSPGEKQIVDLSTPPAPPSAHAEEAIAKVGQPEALLEELGAGPVIAGYATTRYRVSVNDTDCYEEYLATRPLQQTLIQRFVQTLASASTTEADAALEIAIDPDKICQLADNLVDDQYPTLGIPMLTVDTKQQELHRITGIRTDTNHDSDFFTLPKDYRILSRQEVQQQRRAQLDPNAPDVAAREKAIEKLIETHRQSPPQDAPATMTPAPAETP